MYPMCVATKKTFSLAVRREIVDTIRDRGFLQAARIFRVRYETLREVAAEEGLVPKRGRRPGSRATKNRYKSIWEAHLADPSLNGDELAFRFRVGRTTVFSAFRTYRGWVRPRKQAREGTPEQGEPADQQQAVEAGMAGPQSPAQPPAHAERASEWANL